MPNCLSVSDKKEKHTEEQQRISPTRTHSHGDTCTLTFHYSLSFLKQRGLPSE